MKTTPKLSPRGRVCAAGLLLLAMLGSAQAAQRSALTSADVPFYARIERGLIHHDGIWAAIAFYRPPECVRADFNLLDFFDIPAAFGCNAPKPYLTGFAILKSLELGAAPIQSELKLAPDQTMPIWFVRWSELEPFIANDSLVITDLTTMSSLLRGEATFYSETLHPSGGAEGTDGAQQTKTTIVASGFLADGRKFTYQATETKNLLRHVKIEFE
jgi:hypothetical protein